MLDFCGCTVIRSKSEIWLGAALLSVAVSTYQNLRPLARRLWLERTDTDDRHKNPDPSYCDHVRSDGVLSYYALTEVTMTNDGSEEIHKDDEVHRLIV